MQTRIESARKSCGFSQADASAILDMSVPSYKKREQNPELFTVGQLSRFQLALFGDGRKIIDDYISEKFFCKKGSQ